MGRRLPCWGPRQHPDLTEPEAPADPRGRRADPAFRVVVFSLLAVDGVISAVLGAVFLQKFYLGAVPVPFSALISGVANAVLVWAGLAWTRSRGLAGLPVWTWLLAVAVMTFAGPGGDMVFGGPGFEQWNPVVLVVLGVVPPAIVLRLRGR